MVNKTLQEPPGTTRGPGSQLVRAPGAQSRRRKSEERLPTDRLQNLYRAPPNAPRHAAGRLRVRCGSKAPQSGEPATALDQKRISTKNQDNIVAILVKTQIKIIGKTIETHSKIAQTTSNKFII